MHNFKKVCLAVLTFLGSSVLLFFALVYPYFSGQFYSYEDADQRDSLAGTIDTLITGSSHGYCGIDPAELDARLGMSSYNLSGPLLPMVERDQLLTRELERNPVKTVFFELSCNAFTRKKELEGIEGKLYAMPRMEKPAAYFFSTFQGEDFLPALSDTMERGLHSWIAMCKGEDSAIDPKNRGYLPKPTVDQSMTPEEFQTLYNQTTMSLEPTWENKDAFFHMVEECQSRGIEVIFITTPLSDRLLTEYSNLDIPRSWIQYYAEQYDVPFWDFNLWKGSGFPNDTAFFDRYHLSQEGSEAFTALLAEVYTKYKNGEDVSSLFLSNYYELDAILKEKYS